MPHSPELQQDTLNNPSPECHLATLEAQWTAAYDIDPYSNETAVLGNKVLKARANTLLECDDTPLRHSPQTPRQFAPDISLLRAAGTMATSYVTQYFG